MYCISCGVKLADTEKVCPLCQTVVPVARPEAAPLYPPRRPAARLSPHTAQYAAMAAAILAFVICLLCDLQVDGRFGWSGYVLGGLFVGYICLILPSWFRRPNPVIFVPCGFAAAAVYLLYISLVTGGGWFLPFALPVCAGFGLIVTALVTLWRYVRGGRLYILGGGFVALGGMMLLMEWLMGMTFTLPFFGWSIYPLAALGLLGGLLIFLAICRPARQTMERKLFL